MRKKGSGQDAERGMLCHDATRSPNGNMICIGSLKGVLGGG